jgi:branched-chain amino acid transport system substrate-binding protein
VKNKARVISILIMLSMVLSACGKSQNEVSTVTVKPTEGPVYEKGVVYTAEDEGPGSFRETVQEAQPGDVITFDEDTFPVNNPTVIPILLPIELNQGDITIDASNAGVILDGQNSAETGIIIESSDNNIYGLKFVNFTGSGLVIKNNAANNVIGGDPAIGSGPYGQGNAFTNNAIGLAIQDGASNNLVTGNFIGVEADGTDAGNPDGGIIIQNSAQSNIIGPNNIIANTNDFAIMIDGAEQNIVTQNSIYNYGSNPVVLVNGGNRENLSDFNQERVAINCSLGYVKAEIGPSPLTTLEIFSGDENGPKVYEGNMELNIQPDENGEESHTPFIFNKGTPFTGDYLYFTGVVNESGSTTFSSALSCGMDSSNANAYVDTPRTVWSDNFDTDENEEKWMSEFPTEAIGGRIADGSFVMDSPDENWYMAKLVDPLINYLEEAYVSGSQAVLLTFRYTGNPGFRFQASIHPQDNPSYIYETGTQFDEGAQFFIQAPDETQPFEDMIGDLEISPDTDYQYFMGIDDISQKVIIAIWEKDNPENSLKWQTEINADMLNQPWNFVVFGNSQTQIRIDDLQILSFGDKILPNGIQPGECTEDEVGCAVIPAGQPIKVGVGGPMEGDYAIFGIDIANGAQIAVENHENVSGFNFVLVPEDDEASAQGGADAAEKLVADPGVVAVVGHVFSGSTYAAIPFYEEAMIPMVSPSATMPDLSTLDSNVFNRISYSDATQASFAANLMFENLEVRKLAILHDGSSYGEGLANFIKGDFEGLGGKVFAYGAITRGKGDYSEALASIAEFKPDAVYFAGYAEEQIVMANQWDQTGLNGVIMFGSDGTFGDMFIDQTGADGEGAYAVSLIPPHSAEKEAFDQLYRDEFDIEPGFISPFTWAAYDSANLLVTKISEIAILGNDGNLYIPRTKLVEAVRNTQELQGLTCTMTCNEFGECNATGPLFYIVKYGEWVPVE